ncbi:MULTISPECIES: hypothetical protein [Pseudomonas]|uniref:hypothetical protein n=1 Tax=Pseudomonas TaxID=286 RepID=UPI001072A839|nr:MULTISPECIES: hypothetical protein [Pseudomonas]MDD1989901.1 hypothetical protein [Pseudomonas putida]QOH70662.1 hypothetical protein IGB31_24510 [Pseudomonas putida]HDS1796968.1 hypothetical protein [Pseudomonas putida]
MFYTHLSACVASSFEEPEILNWNFVFHRSQDEWLYATKLDWSDGKPGDEYMVQVASVKALKSLISLSQESSSTGKIYLVSPSRMNGDGRLHTDLLLKVEEVGYFDGDNVSISHIYTVDRNGPIEICSSELVHDSQSQYRLLRYDAGLEVVRQVWEEREESTKRLERIVQISARLNENDAAASASWLFAHNQYLGNKRPVDMTSPEEYDRLESYVRQLLK